MNFLFEFMLGSPLSGKHPKEISVGKRLTHPKTYIEFKQNEFPVIKRFSIHDNLFSLF
jgi:hypothetical protein